MRDGARVCELALLRDAESVQGSAVGQLTHCPQVDAPMIHSLARLNVTKAILRFNISGFGNIGAHRSLWMEMRVNRFEMISRLTIGDHLPHEPVWKWIRRSY